METHNIDSKIKRVVEESVNFYDSEADLAKERIWKQVRLRKQVNISLILLRLLVAACILLFFSTSVISVSYYRIKNSLKTVAEANSTLMNKTNAFYQKALIINEPLNAQEIKITDTIYIEKKVMVSQPVIVTKQVIDTVYVRQIVLVEKEQTPVLITDYENSIAGDSNIQNSMAQYETKILISNNEPVKQEKRRRIQFKFGGNNQQISDGTLALSAKF